MERDNFNYVPRKLNKSLFTRLQKIEEKREADIRERKRLEKAQAEEKDNHKNKKAKKSRKKSAQKQAHGSNNLSLLNDDVPF